MVYLFFSSITVHLGLPILRLALYSRPPQRLTVPQGGRANYEQCMYVDVTYQNMRLNNSARCNFQDQ